MNFGMVIKTLGSLLQIEALLLLIPIVVSLLYQESTAIAFVQTLLVTGVIGTLLRYYPVKAKNIKIREALLIVSIGWILISFFGALPYIFSGNIPSWIDAFFESVSGFTTTGATIIPNVEIVPRGVLFWRSFTNWVGGMGILVLTLAVFPAVGVGGVQIFNAESPGPVADKLVPRIADTAKILYTVYIGLTLAMIVILSISGMQWFEACVFTISTVGTGGFSIYNNSIANFSSLIIFILAFFMLISGVNFSLYYGLMQKRWHNVFKNSELRLYLGIIGVSVLLISLNLFGNGYYSLLETIKHALLQVSSIITTTGFTSVDYDLWPSFSKLILFALMFVGGCAGSTSGSVKVIRILVAGKVVKREIFHTLHSRAMVPITINGRTLSQSVVSGIIGFCFLYLALFIGATLLVSLEGVGMVSAASAVAATLGNIGPGFELLGPSRTFADFGEATKLLLCFLMLMGRLELFPMYIILTPGFWRH